VKNKTQPGRNNDFAVRLARANQGRRFALNRGNFKLASDYLAELYRLSCEVEVGLDNRFVTDSKESSRGGELTKIAGEEVEKSHEPLTAEEARRTVG
jgi:hypothetical protein